MPDIRDVILAVCAIAFGYALVPQVMEGSRRRVGTITVQTGAITAVGLYTTAGVFLSLRLWFGGSACAVTATLWLMLLFQRLAYGPPRGR